MSTAPVHQFLLQGEPWYHFAGVLLVITLAVLQARVGRAGALWLILWALPGTILHELAHLVVALITGGRPVGFSVIPHREPGRGGWRLGSVTISRPHAIAALPSALAPLALNLVAYYLFCNWGRWFRADLFHTLSMYAAIYLFSYSSIPSGQDIKVALSSPFGVGLYTAAAGSAWLVLR
ncbi:hypothetical protein GMST_12690 [Geomonas silvestris]|uniref:Peptidase M50 domain-containing protein n=1 Tax=Geomonas silvestris TaxID=2740184 RepID=A0A6V8MGB3_9BACT|nr:hypothetical protein [Geomonas silvestris]GFO58944.1 hypothetical protein GMST_12690 [Geomonas silvestris]